MHKKLLLLFISLLLIACNDKNDTISQNTYLGGEIVNPKSGYIIISKDGATIDTIELDSNNFFSYQFKNPKEGLYSFHHNEYQMFFLEPGDSLLLRVNTLDFDESLIYSGRGSEKNNLLTELFLKNEEETELMPAVYQLPPNEFEEQVDSMYQNRLGIYNNFIENTDVSKTFKKIAKGNIAYDYYSKKELYVSANADNNYFEKKELPDGFFDYRNKIDLNSNDLKSYFSYTRFLNRYFDNLAHEASSNKEYNRNSYAHNVEKIKLIDSLVKNDSIKNMLLRNTTRRYLINARDKNQVENLIVLYKERTSNKKDVLVIDRLASASVKLIPGSAIPDILLVSTDNENVMLPSLIKKNTVLYFWSSRSVKHYRDIHAKAAELKSKYPEYNFIGINTDPDFKKWRDNVKRNNFSKKNEYQIENIENAAQQLVINSINKAIIVDKSGKILEGNTNLFNTAIETQLVGYLNR